MIGTSSVRRVAQLRSRYPKLVFSDVRGNLNPRLAKLDAELVQTPRMLETMVKLVLLYPYLDSPGAAFLFLKDLGDERALPYLIPHVEAHVKIPELIRIIASEDAVMSAQGRLTLALPADQEGALTVANHASAGDLMMSDDVQEDGDGSS